MQDNPVAAADLVALYGLNPRRAPFELGARVVGALIDRLGFEPRSMWRVEQNDSSDWFGWDRNTSVLADLFDMAVLSAKQAGGHKPVLKKGEEYPRPGAGARVERIEKLSDLDWSKFLPSQ